MGAAGSICGVGGSWRCWTPGCFVQTSQVTRPNDGTHRVWELDRDFELPGDTGGSDGLH